MQGNEATATAAKFCKLRYSLRRSAKRAGNGKCKMQMRMSRNIHEHEYVQGSVKRWSPGCVTAAGNGRQKW